MSEDNRFYVASPSIVKMDFISFENNFDLSVSSGFPTLDKVLTGGFGKDEVSVIAGRHGMRSQDLLLSLVAMAVEANFNVLFLAPYWSRRQTIERLIRCKGLFTDLKHNSASKTRQILWMIEKIKTWNNLRIGNTPNVFFDDLLIECGKGISDRQYPIPELIFIDDYERIEGTDRARKLREFAQQCRIPIICVYNIPGESSFLDERPKLSDLPIELVGQFDNFLMTYLKPTMEIEIIFSTRKCSGSFDLSYSPYSGTVFDSKALRPIRYNRPWVD